MAKIRKGILGPLSGKLGPVVGATWKEIPYVRQKPKKKGKKRKRTQGQIATQEKLRFMNNVLVPFHTYINIGFMHHAADKTEISAAFSANYHTAIGGIHPNLEVDYSQLIFSLGSLAMVTDVTMELIDGDSLKLTWNPNTSRKVSSDDQLMLVVYCPELEETAGFVGGVKRNDKECLFKFSPEMVGKALEVYIIMTSINRKKIADSKYLGRIG